jgi:hypothetical protein
MSIFNPTDSESSGFDTMAIPFGAWLALGLVASVVAFVVGLVKMLGGRGQVDTLLIIIVVLPPLLAIGLGARKDGRRGALGAGAGVAIFLLVFGGCLATL